MANLSLPLRLLEGADADASEGSGGRVAGSGGVRLVDTATGEDVTEAMLKRIRLVCPELLGVALQTDLFAPPGAGAGALPHMSCPQSMAAQFQVRRSLG